MRSLKMDGFLVRCHELRYDILKKFFSNEWNGFKQKETDQLISKTFL